MTEEKAEELSQEYDKVEDMPEEAFDNDVPQDGEDVGSAE